MLSQNSLFKIFEKGWYVEYLVPHDNGIEIMLSKGSFKSKFSYKKIIDEELCKAADFDMFRIIYQFAESALMEARKQNPTLGEYVTLLIEI